MTVNKLLKELQKLKDKGHGRNKVMINCNETEEGRLDDWSHTELNSLKEENIRWFVDDSCELVDGSERTRNVVTLSPL